MGKPKIKFLKDRKLLETSPTSEIFQTASTGRLPSAQHGLFTSRRIDFTRVCNYAPSKVTTMKTASPANLGKCLQNTHIC